MKFVEEMGLRAGTSSYTMGMMFVLIKELFFRHLQNCLTVLRGDLAYVGEP